MPLDSQFLGSRLPTPWTVANVKKATDPGKQIACTAALLLKYSLVDPALGSATAYISTGLTSTKLPNAATLTNTRNATDWDGTLGTTGVPDYPRTALITVTHASSIVAVSGTIDGIDLYGRAVSEAWDITAGGTSKTFVGKKAFVRINSITITSAGNATTDTLKLGTTNVFGLPFPCSSVDVVSEMQDGAVVTTEGLLVAASSVSTADRRGTYAPNAAPDGAKDFVVYYISDDPTGI